MTEIEALGSQLIPDLVMVLGYIVSNNTEKIEYVKDRFNIIVTKNHQYFIKNECNM